MPGLLPTCWGNSMWFTIHSIAYTYTPTEANKEIYGNYFKNLGYILPCDECKIHYGQNFKENELKIALESRDALFEWTYNLHNVVNEQTEKPRETWPSLEDVKRRYKNYEVACDAVPGVCGANLGTKSFNQRSTVVIDKVGSITEDSIPYLSVMIIFILISIGLCTYIFTRPIKNTKYKN